MLPKPPKPQQPGEDVNRDWESDRPTSVDSVELIDLDPDTAPHDLRPMAESVEDEIVSARRAGRRTGREEVFTALRDALLERDLTGDQAAHLALAVRQKLKAI